MIANNISYDSRGMSRMSENYESMARELLLLNERMLQVPDRQQIAKLTKGECFVLNYLLIHNVQTHPRDLSKGLAVSTARIAALLNRMEEKHLIYRLPDPVNNRQVIVSLAPRGLALIQELRGQVLAAAAQMLERLGPEDAKEYIRIQKKIVSNVPSQ